MIKLLNAFDGPKLIDISPTETTTTLQQRLQAATGQHFEIVLQETSNNRFLPLEEVLMDKREYFVNFTRLPWE